MATNIDNNAVLIEVQNLRKEYNGGEVVALDNCSMSVKRGERVALTVEIENVSAVDGEETVELYFKDKICKMLTPVRTLLDFKKAKIPAGKRCRVTFAVDTEKLGYHDRNCNYCVDAGEFALYVSGDGKNFKEVTLRIEE